VTEAAAVLLVDRMQVEPDRVWPLGQDHEPTVAAWVTVQEQVLPDRVCPAPQE
jgi:hypothetical protein